MIVITETVVRIIATAVLTAAYNFWSKWRKVLKRCNAVRHMSELVHDKVVFSETDELKIRESQTLIKECFGEDVLYRFRCASEEERIEMTVDLSERLTRLYGIDILTDVDYDTPSAGGAYDWNKRKMTINIEGLLSSSDDEYFNYGVYSTLLSVIHELRHAVQQKAIFEEGFWDVSVQRRGEWARNRLHYIDASVDYERYFYQPIEIDAMCFADKVLRGIIEL